MNPTQKVELLRAACCVAGIDGDASEAEKKVIGIMVKETGVGRASLEAMIERGTTDKEFYKEQFRVLKAEPNEAMSYLLQVALADGVLSEDEINVLRQFSERLEIPSDEFEKLIEKVKGMLGANEL